MTCLGKINNFKMFSAQKKRENFYRISTIIVDHGKEVLILLLDNELNACNQTLEDFINLNQHEIYHLCFNRYTCCQCVNRKLALTTPASRVLHPDQLNILLDKNEQKLSCHNTKSVAQFCCCPAKATLTTKHLDLTLLRCLLINFASICPQNSNIRLAVDDLIGYRNKLYGHAQEARCAYTDYILYKNQIEIVILTIAKSCKKGNEMKQKLKDAEVRPLDETICQQYQNCLLYDIQRNEDIKTEINMIREQSRTSNDQIVQHILETENKINTNISSHNRTISAKMEEMQLNCARRDEILYERVHSNEVKFNEEVHKQNEAVMRIIEKEKEVLQVNHAELIGHLYQTELNIQSKTEETTEVSKLRKLDERKQNLIDQSNAIIQSHREDETFIKTYALEKGKRIIDKRNLLILLAKGGSENNIIVVEDLFGRSNVDFFEDYHRNILDILSNCLKKSKRLKMVFTIKNDPKCEENILEKHEIFLRKCIINLDFDSRLLDKERINILLSHMRHNSIIPCKSPFKVDICLDFEPFPCCSSGCTADVMELPCGKIQICTNTIYQCCMSDTYVGFPETCRMFCNDESLTFLGVAYFRNASKSLVDKINNLFTESFKKLSCRYPYSVLVYTALKCNFFDGNILGYHIEKDALFKRIFSIFDGKKTKIRKSLVKQAIRELKGGYLIESSRYSEFYEDWWSNPRGKAYMFKHQAVHDAVLISFGNECPEMLINLEICTLNFILQYIRPSLKFSALNSLVIHVDPELVVNTLCQFLEKDKPIDWKNVKIKGMSDPWNPPPIATTDENHFQEQRHICESVKYESNNDDSISLDAKSADSDCDMDVFENNDLESGRELSHLLSRRSSELIGEYIRKCIIERKYVSFVKMFLKRLASVSYSPDQITKFLNGLTRRGTCLMNLILHSNIIRDFALKYAEANVFCLIFRPKSSTIKHYKFYQLDDKSFEDKLIAIIDENKNYKIIAEIGNVLYKLEIEDENHEFVKRLLKTIFDKYNDTEDASKIRYIIDGMFSKGKRTDVVPHFREFLHNNLLTHGSIKTIIGLWETLNNETYKSSEMIDYTPLMVVLAEKFKAHILTGTDWEIGVDYKLQTQEYGECLFNLGMQIQDKKIIEELMKTLFDIHNIFLNNMSVYHFVSPNDIKFLIYLYNGITSYCTRIEDAKQMCPLGMEKLHCYISRYKLFVKKVREDLKHSNQSGNNQDTVVFILTLMNMSILHPDTSDDDNDDSDNDPNNV
ncbi:unnamed protein product [Mytilus coruscus]|uniref:DZIP3-like HEPN domain-containing protein n=1 Tax=Mytilus coruscus TaxID=42192 RepID=A0A6J8D222_MYTCO|nr:unnamed protein product [Mytilus coruscus]